MSEVKREHLAGLKLARNLLPRQSMKNHIKELDSLIVQASAAPEQDPVAWVPCSPEWLKAGGDCATAPRICCAPGQGVSHLHPSHEIARLRADLGEAKGEYDRSTNKVAELRDLLEATSQRADAAERKLASVTEYVQGLVSAAGSQPSVATGYLRDILETLQSASAEPTPSQLSALQDEQRLGIERLPVEPAKGGDGEASNG